MDANELIDLLREVVGCFVLTEEHWYLHKSNTGKWVEVNEDLQDLLTQAQETLDAGDE